MTSVATREGNSSEAAAARRQRERGSATAELAIVLPIVALLVGLILSAGILAARISTVSEAAAAAARSLGRGENESQARAIAVQVQSDVTVSIDRVGDVVCVTAIFSQRLAAIPVDLSSRVCAPTNGR